MESPAVRAKPETPDVVQATETGAEPTDLDSAANRCVSYPNSWVSWCELSSEREVRLGCRRSRVAICSPERNWTPAKADGTGGCIAPSTPRSRTESRHCGGFGHYSTLLVLLLGLSRTATVGSVTLTASYPASFFPAGEVPRQHPGLLSRRRRRLLVLRPRPKRRCQKYQKYSPW